MLECIHIARRFQNNTERPEGLFELYIKMTTANGKPSKRKQKVTS